jgi:valyl-tRNA synthetase
MNVYRLFWNEFSSWYLEIIKPEYQKPIDKKTLEETISFFDNLIRLIHPFMPFISEEIWQMLYERKDGESLMISRMPESKKSSKDLLARFEIAKETISTIRTIRKGKELPTKEKLMLCIRSDENSFDKKFLPVIIKLGNLSGVKFVAKKQKGAASFMVRTTEFFIPLGDKLDVIGELKKIRDELDYYKGFLMSVMKKLDNERFIKNAPESVLELERKKKSDAEAKIKALEEAIKALRN